MSIDARVKAVRVLEDGSGELVLEDRPPARPGDSGGNAGQRALRFGRAPHDVAALTGRYIWGGDDTIMLGDREIARREGYTGVRFTVPDFASLGLT